MTEEVKIEISIKKFTKYFIIFLGTQFGLSFQLSTEQLIVALFGAGFLAGWNYVKHKWPMLNDIFKVE